jgi:lipoprotein-anchoring transpeptidase ErfK/SrfK
MSIGNSLAAVVVLSASASWLCGCAGPAMAPATASSTASPTVAVSTPTRAVAPPQVGASQNWIEVDLARQVVRLRRGQDILAEYPASSGVAVSLETATQPGIYGVQQLIKGPIENVPGVFVSDILIYDILNGAGIHSLPMDKEGHILDATLGSPASAGCVRVGEAAAVFAFARLGTVIWIH